MSHFLKFLFLISLIFSHKGKGEYLCGSNNLNFLLQKILHNNQCVPEMSLYSTVAEWSVPETNAVVS